MKIQIENDDLIISVFWYVHMCHRTKANRGKHKQLILTKHIPTMSQKEILKERFYMLCKIFFNNLKNKEEAEDDYRIYFTFIFLINCVYQ